MLAESPVKDQKTADAFATSWNNLPGGSVYSVEQFEEWFSPLTKSDIQGKTILELGCGNGSLLAHIVSWLPSYATGVDLGASVIACRKNMEQTGFKNYSIVQHDLTTFRGSEQFDIVYCIGVLHHLKNPLEGLTSVIRNTKSKGKFHCWVYAKEGNAVIRYIVDPIRKAASKMPWWVTKYLIATPLSVPYFIYAHIISRSPVFKSFPLYDYSRWITKRNFLFFRHVAFDQLVTPQTIYVSKEMIEGWLSKFSEIDQSSAYIIFRNGNSWKFGATLK
jgi:SAM-dependent methyltransferase